MQVLPKRYEDSESLTTKNKQKRETCWRLINLAIAGAWQGQRAKAVEKALLGSSLDVQALIQALQALPQDLHPSPTPGTPCSLLLCRNSAYLSTFLHVMYVFCTSQELLF